MSLLCFPAAGQVDRPSIEIPDRHNYVQVFPDTKKAISFAVENTAAESKGLNVSLKGVNASFEGGNSSRDGIQLGGNSRIRFSAVIEPQSPGSKELTITAKNNRTLLATSRTIAVETKNPRASDDREVPGVGTIHVIAVSVAALGVFWAL